jgi:acyl dehydratase
MAPASPALVPGQVLRLERTYTADDVQRFSQLSGDPGAHAVELDAEGRAMVHGLFVAMLPVQLGSELSLVAREMSFELVRPVFVGDTVVCELVVREVEEREGRLSISAEIVATDQNGGEVMRGRIRGVLPQITSAAR